MLVFMNVYDSAKAHMLLYIHTLYVDVVGIGSCLRAILFDVESNSSCQWRRYNRSSKAKKKNESQVSKTCLHNNWLPNLEIKLFLKASPSLKLFELTCTVVCLVFALRNTLRKCRWLKIVNFVKL